MAATASGSVNVKLTGDAKAILSELKKVEAQFNRLGIQIKKINESTAKIASSQQTVWKNFTTGLTFANRSINTTYKALNKFTGAIFNLRTAMTMLSVGVALKSVIDTGIEFNRWNASLEAVVGSSQEVVRVQNMLKDTAEEVGLRYKVLLEQYTKFRAAAEATGISISEIDKIFTSVSKGAAVFQLTAEDTYEIFRALTQMLSKGTISAEELRGQFGERIPGALVIMANAIGVSLKQLLKLMEDGELISGEVLPKMGEAMDKEFGEKVKKVSQSAVGQINRFMNALDMLKDQIAKSGLLEGLIQGMRQLKDAMADEKNLENMKQIGRTIGEIIANISGFVNFLTSVPREIIGLLIGMFLGAAAGPWGMAIGGLAGATGASLTRGGDARSEIQKTIDEITELKKLVDKTKKEMEGNETGTIFNQRYREGRNKQLQTILNGYTKELEYKGYYLKSLTQPKSDYSADIMESTASKSEAASKMAKTRMNELKQEIELLKLKHPEQKKILEITQKIKKEEEELKKLVDPDQIGIKQLEIEKLKIELKNNQSTLNDKLKQDAEQLNKLKVEELKILEEYHKEFGIEEDQLNIKMELLKREHEFNMIKGINDTKLFQARKQQLEDEIKLLKHRREIEAGEGSFAGMNDLDGYNEARINAGYITNQKNKSKETDFEAIHNIEKEINRLREDNLYMWDTEKQKVLEINRALEEKRKILEAANVSEATIVGLLEKYKAALEDKKTQETLKNFSSFMTDNLVQGFEDAITGAKSFKDAFRDMTRSILIDLARMAMKAAFMQAFGSMFGQSGSTGASFASAISSIFGMANGGVLSGGFQSFASGGKVTQPTLGLVGEGRYNEAIVPLPDGRSIPVQMKGGSRGDVNVTINVDGSKGGTTQQNDRMAKQIAREVKEQVKAILVDERRYGGVLGKQAMGTI